MHVNVVCQFLKLGNFAISLLRNSSQEGLDARGFKPSYIVNTPIENYICANHRLIIMASRFGRDDIFMCACGETFRNKQALNAHITNIQDGREHYPTGMS